MPCASSKKSDTIVESVLLKSARQAVSTGRCRSESERVTTLDVEVGNEAILLWDKIYFVILLSVPLSLDDDVNVFLKQVDSLFARWRLLTVVSLPLRFIDHAQKQRSVAVRSIHSLLRET